MNWALFKDPVSHMCLAGAVETSWSLTQEVAVSSSFTVLTNIFVTEFRETDHHRSMIWAQFKDPVSHMCLAGAVVAS